MHEQTKLAALSTVLLAIAAGLFAVTDTEAMFTPTKLHPAKKVDPEFSLDWPADRELGAMALRAGVRLDGKDVKGSVCYGKASSKRACVWHLTAKGRSRRADTVWRVPGPGMSDLLIVLLAAGDYCFDGFLSERFFVSTTAPRTHCTRFTIEPNKLTYIGDVLVEANPGATTKKTLGGRGLSTSQDSARQTGYGKGAGEFRISITTSQSDMEALLRSVPNIREEDVIWRESLG